MFEGLLNVLIFGMCLKPGDARIGRLYIVKSMFEGLLNEII